MKGRTLDIQSEPFQTGYRDDTRVVHSCVEDVHGEGGRAVHDTVPRVQSTPHEQVDQFIRATAHLAQRHNPHGCINMERRVAGRLSTLGRMSALDWIANLDIGADTL